MKKFSDLGNKGDLMFLENTSYPEDNSYLPSFLTQKINDRELATKIYICVLKNYNDNIIIIKKLKILSKELGIPIKNVAESLDELIGTSSDLLFSGDGIKELKRLGYKQRFNTFSNRELKKLRQLTNSSKTKPSCNLNIQVSDNVLKRRPLIQRLGIERIGRFETNPMETLPELAIAYGNNGKVREEQRIAVVLVLRAMIYCLDLATMKLGCLRTDFFGRIPV